MRPVVTSVEAARQDLGPSRTMPSWRARELDLPLDRLTGDEFEVFCYLLLWEEHPGEGILYYGKTGDSGRDIVRRRADGKLELIQCKCYGRPVGIEDVRRELAKLFINVFEKKIPQPDYLTFYVVPDLSNPGTDLLLNQSRWIEEAEEALEDRLGHPVPEDLLRFALSWWPKTHRETALDLTRRAKRHDNLIEEFFEVRKVIDGSIEDAKNAFREVLEERDRKARPNRSTKGLPRAQRDWLAFFKELGREDIAYLYLSEWGDLTPDQRFEPPAEFEEITKSITENPLTLVIGPPSVGKTFLALQILWQAFQSGREVSWIGPAALVPTDGPIPDPSRSSDHEEQVRQLTYKLSRKALQPLEDPYEFIAHHLGANRTVYIEDPFGKKDDEFEGSLHRSRFFNLQRFVEALVEGGTRADSRILITSREGLFERWLEEGGQIGNGIRVVRLAAESYGFKQLLRLATRLTTARKIQEAEDAAYVIASRVDFPFEVESVIRGLPSNASEEEAIAAAEKWRGNEKKKLGGQITADSPEDKLFLLILALEMFREDYARLHKALHLEGDADQALERSLKRYGAFVVRKKVTYFQIGGDSESFKPTHSLVEEAIADFLGQETIWLEQVLDSISKGMRRRTDLILYLLSLGLGQEPGQAQDTLVKILFEEKDLAREQVVRLMRTFPRLGASFKERLFKYLETDPNNIVRRVAAALHSKIDPADAWKILRLLLKQRYLVQGNPPFPEIPTSHPWHYFFFHLDEAPVDLRESLEKLAADEPALFTYALGELLVWHWEEIPWTFQQAFLDDASRNDLDVQEKVLGEIAFRWSDVSEELLRFFRQQAAQGPPLIRAEAMTAARGLPDDERSTFESLLENALRDEDLRVPLAAMESHSKDEIEQSFVERLLARADEATAAAMLQKILEPHEKTSEWDFEMACACLAKGGNWSLGVLAYAIAGHSSSLALRLQEHLTAETEKLEIVRLARIWGIVNASPGDSEISPEKMIGLAESLPSPYRDFALLYLSRQWLDLPKPVQEYVDRFENEKGDEGDAVREGKKKRHSSKRPATSPWPWKLPILWIAAEVKAQAKEVVSV